MMFALGILTGITLCVFIAVIYKRYETSIMRSVNQVESKLQQKGSIIEPEAEDMEDWMKTIEKDL